MKQLIYLTLGFLSLILSSCDSTGNSNRNQQTDSQWVESEEYKIARKACENNENLYKFIRNETIKKAIIAQEGEAVYDLLIHTVEPDCFPLEIGSPITGDGLKYNTDESYIKFYIGHNYMGFKISSQGNTLVTGDPNNKGEFILDTQGWSLKYFIDDWGQEDKNRPYYSFYQAGMEAIVFKDGSSNLVVSIFPTRISTYIWKVKEMSVKNLNTGHVVYPPISYVTQDPTRLTFVNIDAIGISDYFALKKHDKNTIAFDMENGDRELVNVEEQFHNLRNVIWRYIEDGYKYEYYDRLKYHGFKDFK